MSETITLNTPGAARPARATRRTAQPRERSHGKASANAAAGKGKPSNSSKPGSFFSAHAKMLVALLVAAVVVAALYGPTQDLYCAWRDQQALVAQKAALDTANEQALADIDRLQTEDGIKDEARKRGYVEEGETALVVSGLEDDAATDAADATASSDASNDPWYLALLDVLFGYSPVAE